MRIFVTLVSAGHDLRYCLGTLRAVPAKSDFRLQKIQAYYQTMYSAWGPQHWWPGRTQFEVIVGAYLTQNTSWKNVELALTRLRSRGALSLAGIRRFPLEDLEAMIRPSGYFRQKAARLKIFVDFVDRRYGGSLKRMFARPTHELRHQLLSLHGIGRETADSILLYAGQTPVFVVDAYARRILDRHNILPEDSSYEEARELFERALVGAAETNAHSKTQSRQRTSQRSDLNTAHTPSPMSRARRSKAVQVMNDAHALIVALGKNYCFKSNPDCERCPLRRFLPDGRPGPVLSARRGVSPYNKRISED